MRVSGCTPAHLSAMALVVAAFAVPSMALVPTYRTVALTGTTGVYGPNMGATTFASSLDFATINYSGLVAFRGLTSGTTFSTNNGVWRRPDATNTSFNENLALEGGARPGGGTYSGGTSVGYNQIAINNGGMVSFRLSTSLGAFSNDGITMQRVALAGDVAPGTGGATYGTGPIASGMPLFNQSGASAYLGTLTVGTGSPAVVTTSGSNNSTALFVGTGDNSGGVNPNVTPVIRASDWFASLGGTAADTKVNTFGNLTMGFNDNGHYVGVNTLQGSAVLSTPVASANNTAILSNRTGSNDVIARRGNAAPDGAGAPTAELYNVFGSGRVGLNNMEHVAFVANVRNAAGTVTAQSIFADVGGGSVKRLYSNGQSLTGQVYAFNDSSTALAEFSGVTFSTSTAASMSSVLINGNDEMLLQANLSVGTGGTVFKRDAAGLLHRVVRVGDNPFGGPDPLTTGGTGTSTFSGLGGLAMNAMGQVAFTGNLTGPGVSVGLGNGSTLWVMDQQEGLVMIARTGTLFTDALGNVKTVSTINFQGGSGNQDGLLSGFNDRGEITFALGFTDGTSGIFVTQIPTPGALALLGLSGLVATRRRRAK